MPRSRALALLVLLAAGCGEAQSVLDWPRLTDETGIDPVLLERIRTVESACARGEDGSWLELAMVYDANDLNQLAERTYEACLQLPPEKAGASRSVLHFHRARALDDLGRAEDALHAYDSALELEDAYAPARWRRGQLLLDAGRVAEARADFERAVVLEPDSAPAHLGLARVLLVQDRPEEARATLLAVLAREPNERFVHGLLARALLALGDEQGAERELALEERATGGSGADPLAAEVRKRATGVQIGVLRATEALKADKPGEAIRILRPLYQRVPDDLALLQVFGRSLVTAGEYDRALEVLARGCRAHPEDGKLELFAGLALKGKGSLAEACVRLERARALNPSFPPTHTALGEVWNALGRFPEAEEALTRALECGDGELSTLLLLGQTQMNQSAWTRAVATFARATAQVPDSGLAWTHLAEAQVQAGDPSAAERSLAEASKHNPGSKRIEAVRRLLAAQGSAR
jgi:superkiller protein 3